KLMMEGHNPANLARQLVRLLRNVLVAKVSGNDSALLQISSDERARAGRIAEQFSEEDLARFLQIMLRTFDELGYRQEQRFHLELGVLKLVHAQRLLPLEQVLTQVAAGGTKLPMPSVGERRSSQAPGAPGGSSKAQPRVSPFDADRERKTRNLDPEMSAGSMPSVQANGTTAAAVAVIEAPAVTAAEAAILSAALSELLKGTGTSNLVSTLETGTVETTP